MRSVNRSVLIVSPKQPFLDWVNSLGDPTLNLDEIRQDPTAYLIPEVLSNADQSLILEELFAEIVAYELASWCLDEETWPQIESLGAFQQWFDVSFHSFAVDLDVIPLEYEDDTSAL